MVIKETPMRSLLPFVTLALFLSAPMPAADEPAAAPRTKSAATRGNLPFPTAVDGLSATDLAKVRSAFISSAQDAGVVKARNRLNDLLERVKFTKGRQEAEDLRLDFTQAEEALLKAVITAAIEADSTLTKEVITLAFNAMSELRKQRGQEASAKAQASAQAAERAKLTAEGKTSPPKVARTEATTPAPSTELFAEVEGVSKEEMKQFRSAAIQVRNDAAIKALKAKVAELRKQAEYASDTEKRDLRGTMEGLVVDLHKAHLAAISAAAPSLKSETIETILYEVAKRMKATTKPTRAPTK